jgi:hypothetical protein
MNTCSCGNIAEENSAQCARCKALQALELKADAITSDIENAFEVLSKAWNPDRFEDGSPLRAAAEQKRTAIQEAHSFLIRSSVQAAPYRSHAPGERAETPIDTVPQARTRGRTSKTRKLGYSDGEERPLRLPLPLLIGGGVVVAGIAIAWLLFKPLDSVLMSTPVAGSIYASYKTSIRSGIQALKNKAGVGTGPSAPASPGDAPIESASNPMPGTATQEISEAAPGAQRIAATQRATNRTVIRVHPFITAGLSKSEVIATQGAPTSESGNELDYGSSKLYFSNDALIGWKIDPGSPIHVKLWPDAMVNPDLRWFRVGSSKNDVIAVQGTPTFLSENTFGYGASEVHFQDNHVVSWKSDPSAPLRTSTP